MPAPIPVEVRKRIVEAFDQGNTREEVADLFGVSPPTVTRFLARRRNRVDLAPTPHPGPVPVLDEKAERQMHGWIEEQSDLTLAELKTRLESIGCSVGITTIFDRLRRMGLRRKKNAARHRTRSARRADPKGNLAGGRKPDTCAKLGVFG